ncbi:hypothetical protein AUC43_17700 [Hymenobacter sedentarius]|uniref:YtxH domain-containing protein n=1 Tax=Hymenobacter sedentarius TaxID=1411621 RepID=A0A0U4CTK0_9BACT|nr:YtxH domain-containing protein [Hymenobacter sedentarius]ALW86750.1 hypothetical protein AUC43_17700 [Hymenobacter sedentarius]
MNTSKNNSRNTSRKAADRLSANKLSVSALLAFGAASAAGILAGVLWAPSPGQQTRSKLANRLRTMTQPLMGPGRSQQGRPAGASRGGDLSMQPDHLLEKPKA